MRYMKLFMLVFFFSTLFGQDSLAFRKDLDLWWQNQDRGDIVGLDFFYQNNHFIFDGAFSNSQIDGGWYGNFNNQMAYGLWGYSFGFSNGLFCNLSAGPMLVKGDLFDDTETGYMGKIQFKYVPERVPLFCELSYADGGFFDNKYIEVDGTTNLKLGYQIHGHLGLFGDLSWTDGVDFIGGGLRFHW